MANLGETFDPDTVPADEFTPLPDGEYLAQIVESEMKATKSGNGEMLKLTWQVMAGPLEGRKFWDQLNIRNPNEIAQRIALQSMKKICEAAGVGAITDSEELHEKPIYVKLKVKSDPNYGDKNEVKGYRPYTQAAPPKVGAASKAPPPAAKAAGSRPWGQR